MHSKLFPVEWLSIILGMLLLFGRSAGAGDEPAAGKSADEDGEAMTGGSEGTGEEKSEAETGQEEAMVFEAEETVVTGTRTKRLVLDTPVKTEVVKKEEIENKGATNLVEALAYEPGLRVDNQCSICNTTTVKISGIPGRYSLLLVNGMPIMSSLGMTYGLLNISAANIEKLEIVHGAGSVLYGTDAIGGVINVITEKPSKDPHGTFEAKAGMFGYRNLSGYGSLSAGKLGVSIVATHAGHDKVDQDHNGVNEYAGYVRSTAAGMASVDILDNLGLLLSFSVAQENRQGGGLGSILEVMDDYDESTFTGRRAFTETILTDRYEGGLVLDYSPIEKLKLETIVSSTYHDQDSDYEGEVYHARQFLLFVQESAVAALHPRYGLVGGIAYRLEYLDENLAVADYTYHMPGVFAEGDWRITDHLELVHGVRYDHHNTFGNVYTGRGALKLSMLDRKLVVRGVMGTGFRTPTTFYEYAHGVRTEGYKFVDETDSAEQSLGGNVSATLDLGRKFQFVVEYAVTRIWNPISIENTDDGHIRTYNVDEPLDVFAIEAQAQTQALQWMVISAGYGWYHYHDRGGSLVTAPPVHQLTFGIQLHFRRIGLRGSLFAEVFSPMDLEDVYGPGYNAVEGTDLEGWLDPANADLNSPKRKKSPWYGVVNLRLEQRIYKGLSAMFGIDNILDYHQNKIESPLFYPADDQGLPMGADVTYIWGPLRGRFIYGGLKLAI
jgi:outer membrane receptor for ferrienterochelin and colicins